ncbi:hypothetical protein GZ77_24800 [Endozoicomonas montiporae]|uniref:D-amino-acid oxidase n=2 Tax=Endozoicomonas montiporae TaxID=1027273 RepID=A0A081MZV6_9GAMM|nr:FAD-dependent oxidoreductase [Endozoicomonas montiporae]AMO54581.1 hypothetical protein EZMO1_0327 [Endozoicomonas montiporae CL-33]KEQ11729.1 hypothetical protein GZ77_24800 [Endozoicomonas montiporae]
MEIPRLTELIDLAIKHGSINWFAGSRPTADSPFTGFGDRLFLNGHSYPTYHAYGYGGAGISLSQGVADQVIRDFDRNHLDKRGNVLVIGAGIVGLSIARALIQAGYQQLTMLSAFYPPGSGSLPEAFSPVSKENYYPSCVGGGYIMPVKFGTKLHSRQTRSIIENSQHGWEALGKNPSYSAMIRKGSRISLLPVDPRKVKSYRYDAMAINQLLGYELYPIEIHEQPLTGFTINDQPFKRTAHSIIEIHNTLMIDPVSIQQQFIKELSDSRRVSFLQEVIHSPESLQKHLSPGQTIVNASGTGMGSIFGVSETTPVRGDLIVATIPLKSLSFVKNISSDHHSFYTPGMTFHMRFNSHTMTVVLGGTNLTGVASTEFSQASIRHILKHWYAFAHCPDNCHNQDKNSLISLNNNKYVSCCLESNAFVERVIDSFPDNI